MTLPIDIWKLFGPTGSGYLCIGLFQFYRVFAQCHGSDINKISWRSVNNFLSYKLLNFSLKKWGGGGVDL